MINFYSKIDKNKLDHSPETGELLEREDDILYQWRLKRKIEEAKGKTTPRSNDKPNPSKSDFDQLPLKSISNINISKLK